MFSGLLQWELLSKAIINTILISIPEETFVVLFTIVLLGMFNYLSYENVSTTGETLKKSDIIKASIPILIPSISSSILKYFEINYLVTFSFLITSLIVSIIIVYGLWRSIKDICKVVLFLGIAVTIVYTVEYTYIPLILFSTGKTIVEMYNMVFLNFSMFLPERILETFIMVFLITKKTTILKANIIQPILNNRISLATTVGTVVGNMALMGVLYNIYYSGILESLSLTLQIVIIVLSLTVPVLSIFGLLWGVYCSENKRYEDEKILIDNVENYIQDIKSIYTETKESDKLNLLLEKLKKIEKEVNSLNIRQRRG